MTEKIILTANLARIFAPDPTPKPMNLFTLKINKKYTSILNCTNTYHRISDA